jgi:protein-glutamine gamma-glutamyltransferase
MSAWVEDRAGRMSVRDARADERVGRLRVRLPTFFVVTAMCALTYAGLLYHPATGAALAVAGIATACGGALWLALEALGGARRSWAARLPPRATRAAVTFVTTLVALELGLLAIGVPAHLIAPWHWGKLASSVNGGLGQLGRWTWPYLGNARWARIAVLMLLVPATTVMALLFFWPTRPGAGARRVGALAIAVALALCGMTNAPGGAWRAQGLLLLVLVFAWLWLPTLRGFDAVRAIGWTAACALAALIAAPLLSGSHAWIPFASADSTRGAPRPSGSHAWIPYGFVEGTHPIEFQPDQLYRPIKGSPSQEPMLTVRAGQPPGLLRMTSLDRFDGLRFIRSDSPPETAATDIRAGAEASWYSNATITVEGLRSSLLVGAAGIATRVTPQGGRPPIGLQRAADGTLSLPGALAPGATYTVASYAPRPTAAQLSAAPRAFPQAYLPYTEFELPSPSASGLQSPQLAREAGSPPQRAELVRGSAIGTGEASASAAGAQAVAQRIRASPYGRMYALARHLAAGAASTYEAVTRIELYLLLGYSYDEQPPLARYPLESFVFDSRRGYCQQFSGAMTLMLRMDGIPARVGVGFKPVPLAVSSATAAREAGSSYWTARALDAHAWVEVFFSGIGWVPFDPTPAANVTGSEASGPVSKGRLLSGQGSAPWRWLSETVSPSASSHAARHRVRKSAGGGPLGLSGWQSALLALAIALTLAAWLRSRAARARTRATEVLSGEIAVRELEHALRGLAWPLLPGMTLTHVEQRLERAAQPQAAAYVRRLRERRFGRTRVLTAAQLSAARAERLALRRALARGRGLHGRLRALRLLPPRAPSL